MVTFKVATEINGSVATNFRPGNIIHLKLVSFQQGENLKNWSRNFPSLPYWFTHILTCMNFNGFSLCSVTTDVGEEFWQLHIWRVFPRPLHDSVGNNLSQRSRLHEHLTPQTFPFLLSPPPVPVAISCNSTRLHVCACGICRPPQLVWYSN